MDNKKKNRHIMNRFKTGRSHDCLPFATTRKVTRGDLPEIYAHFGYTVGAEIGVSRGKHSKWMCEKVPNLKLYCIDPYIVYHVRRVKERQQQIYEFACKFLADYNAEVIRKTSMEAVKDFDDESLDFVYIDGNHKFDYVMTDLIFWAQKVKSGGMIALHDYCHFHWAGIVKAVNAYTYSHSISPWFITREEKPTVFWVKE